LIYEAQVFEACLHFKLSGKTQGWLINPKFPPLKEKTLRFV